MTREQRLLLTAALDRIQCSRQALAGNWSAKRLREEVHDTQERLRDAEAKLLKVAMLER